MCRLLGIVASEPTEFRLVLREAPRSMAALSLEHRDGWGLAIHDGADHDGWKLHKGILCASEDEHFHRLAVGSRGETLISHIRQRTVGVTSLDNTHPFQRDSWVFAHNGTIRDVDYLRAGTSPRRLGEIVGQTDSELLFAFLLTRIDASGPGDVDRVVLSVTEELRARKDFGAFNFLLSDGRVTYAHRFGRSLFLLERGPEDAVRASRESRDGTIVQTPWSQRRQAIFVASERLTDEPWEEITDGLLLRLDARPSPRWRLLHTLAA